MQKVYLIGCGKAKQPGKHKARDLYTSDYFKTKLAYALKQGGPCYILSAKYALLDLDSEVDTYDRTMKDLTPDERKEWGKKAADDLRQRFPADDTVFVMLCGKEYWTLVVKYLGEECCEFPLAHLRNGQQSQWMKKEIEK